MAPIFAEASSGVSEVGSVTWIPQLLLSHSQHFSFGPFKAVIASMIPLGPIRKPLSAAAVYQICTRVLGRRRTSETKDLSAIIIEPSAAMRGKRAGSFWASICRSRV
jgi:hypothetical protein